jgi:hypothetical protein
MNKYERETQARMLATLESMGISYEDTHALRRISMTLRRWHELECGNENGAIERDDITGKPFWVSEWGGQWSTGKRCRTPIADRETGARKRLNKIMAQYPTLKPYIQGDPRGAALYILRPNDVPENCDVNAYYSSGICIF